MRKNITYTAIFIFFEVSIVVSFVGCGKGLDPGPEPQPYGIAGTIRFQHWPPQDSVHDLRVVMFKHFSPQDILSEVLRGNAKYSESLVSAYDRDSASYTLFLSPLPPGRYEYVVVAQQYGPNLQSHWRAVGVYYANNDTTRPGVVFVPENTVVHGINMNVDFQNLPPQP